MSNLSFSEDPIEDKPVGQYIAKAEGYLKEFSTGPVAGAEKPAGDTPAATPAVAGDDMPKPAEPAVEAPKEPAVACACRGGKQAPAVTTIHALGDDLLREIFLRLPSLPGLVRAALACRPFLAAVSSSPAFRRRFRELHPLPLVGFFNSNGSDIPSFTPVRHRSDPDLAAAEVFLTRLHHEDASTPTGWAITGCHGGRLLLLNWNTEQIAVYNPLTRALDLVPMPPDEISNGCRGKFCYSGFFLISNDDAPGSFRVVLFCHDESSLRAAVFASRTREWQILP
ncbi:hypothetical protein BAE44_0002797 [Dichanthelium oligosanthes]|uniref:F-box domain-containing protein n=1 Tax=Dichanthelium oligosanthes TaxID=888268 RepID=A0A1E5WFL7_9POAL|nr:hypothetical protein BAE44_0002797 [Dichanthelium oligosanthes]